MLGRFFMSIFQMGGLSANALVGSTLRAQIAHTAKPTMKTEAPGWMYNIGRFNLTFSEI